jgi:stage IV sporulation protein FA
MRRVINKFLILLICFLLIAIGCKYNSSFRQKVHYYLYEDNLAFSNFRNFYNKYLGDVFPLKSVGTDTVSVFSEDLQYSSISKYLNGYSLSVSQNYLVPAINSGIITYIGEKDDFGNVVIVLGEDGVSIWYGNIENINFKLYDSVLVGDFIGEVSDQKLLLSFFDGNKYLEYDDYMK